MKKNLKSIALLAVLSLAAAGCQKETIVEQGVQVQQNASVRTVIYTVDGMTMQISLRGEQEWQNFLNWMFALAEEGHQVTFFNDSARNNIQSTKEKVVYTTDDKSDALRWAADMTENGYEVTIVYDSSTGIYTCTAIN